MLPITTILHATDFSDQSNFAFRLACSLARDYGARLIVVHVVEPEVAIFGDGMVVPPPRDQEPLRAKLHELIPRDPKVCVEHRLVDGNPAAEILQLAVETECDLIMLGTHGRTGLGRLLMGSVAENVVRRAPCPVLTVKTPLAQMQVSEKVLSQTPSEVAGATKG
jgi:nucleotide-binding universal stress UspA family protein